VGTIADNESEQGILVRACAICTARETPGGWLVATEINGGVIFLPDPNHEWDGNSLPSPR